MSSPPAGTAPPVRRGVRWGTIVGTLVVAFGFLVGLDRLYDNSFFTHLATGRLILDGGIPRSDPYSFTAAGESWVVQSWLVSWVFAVVDDLVGPEGIRVLVAVMCGAITGVVWMSTSPARSLLLRLGTVAVGFAALAPYFAERPLLVGLLGVGLCVLAMDGLLDPRWLVPLGWVWVNSHGSFPLGLAVLVVAWVGTRLDRSDPQVEARAVVWFAVGAAAGALNPLGPRLLWFPVALLDRSGLLREHVREWQPFGLHSPGAWAALAVAILAVWAVIRRPSWRSVGLVVFAIAGAAMSRRNVPIGVIVVLPVIARSLPILGSLRAETRLRLGRPVLAALALAITAVTIGALRGPALSLEMYPVEIIDRLEQAEVVGPAGQTRVLTEDFVGNYMTLRFGEDASVFLDDRYDMYPLAVLEDYLLLLREEVGGSSRQRILDSYEIDVVVWRRDQRFDDWITDAAGWVEGPSDDRFRVMCREDSRVARRVCS